MSRLRLSFAEKNGDGLETTTTRQKKSLLDDDDFFVLSHVLSLSLLSLLLLLLLFERTFGKDIKIIIIPSKTRRGHFEHYRDAYKEFVRGTEGQNDPGRSAI